MCDCSDEKAPKPTELEKELSESFLKQRKIFLWDEIDDKLAKDVVARLLYLDSKSSEDIYLYINSPGGVITAGCAILDAMDAVESDVITIVTGQAASMAAVILACGARGKRYAWPRSRVMIHQPLISGHIHGVNVDLQIQAEEITHLRYMMNLILSEKTGKTLEQIEEDTDRDFFMSSHTAQDYGMVDFVETKR